MRAGILALGLAIMPDAAAQPAESPRVTGLDFATGWRDLRGTVVTVTDCAIAGTTPDFVRCETPNGAFSYSLDADTMDKDALRFAYATCPTGSRRKPACHVAVSGRVHGNREPMLSDGRIQR